ncbi:hypothetical protein K7432_005709 [Basidiobolus ranarum]|uniref:RING-type domain-containing protein n=1 Tax=Basidiobolus ranarum TaxID=34480 RepID=A0ABR2W2V8_9FUNG
MYPFQPKHHDPPLCFCLQPATPSDSVCFGAIYECHFKANNPPPYPTQSESKSEYQTSNLKLEQDIDSIISTLREINQDDQVSFSESSRPSTSFHKPPKPTQDKICGFHIHKKAWDSFFSGKTSVHLNNDNFQHRELKLCPFFNFTFCVYFRLSNAYSKQYPVTPTCFCGGRVIINRTYREGKNYRRYGFGCPNYKIGGRRERCTWFLWAEQLRFDRPLEDIHASQLPNEKDLLSHNASNAEVTDISGSSSISTPSDTDERISDLLPVDTSSISNTHPDRQSLSEEHNPDITSPTAKDELTEDPDSKSGALSHSLDELQALEVETQHLHLANTRLNVKLNEYMKNNEKFKKRVQDLETSISDLTVDLDSVYDQQHHKGIGIKCRICYERSITHAITPCFHFALCEKCATFVQECCICRVKQTGTQRIYMA